jgi:acetate kinase
VIAWTAALAPAPATRVNAHGTMGNDAAGSGDSGDRDRQAMTVTVVRQQQKRPADSTAVLTMNAGSSSIKFAVYETGTPPRRAIGGTLDRIGSSRATLIVNGGRAGSSQVPRRDAADHGTAAAILLDWLEAQPIFASVKAVGHRVVHGMTHSKPATVTPTLLKNLRGITPYDPDHLPREISLIEALLRRHPRLRQVACFDTAFHRSMPPVARLLPIPRRYAGKGVARYGFHGLSYAYLMEELARLEGAVTKRRVILAHLGSGASLAAVRDGRSIDTSMGFTPTAGLVMSTRSGDLDPGLMYYLARVEHMTPAGFQRMVNHESGLLGVSGISADLRVLLAREAHNARAAEAVELFCYQVKKWIGAFAAALGGLDTLVFSAGIGENAPVIRKRICDGLGFLGVELDPTRNARNAPIISRSAGSIKVRVIRTDEEVMIARSVIRLLNLGSTRRA